MIARWGPDEAFEYLMELGDDVRATQVITTLVKGMQARVNHDDDDVRASLLPQC